MASSKDSPTPQQLSMEYATAQSAPPAFDEDSEAPPSSNAGSGDSTGGRPHSESYTDSAYNYASSTITGAFGYVSSLYSPDKAEIDAPQTINHSKSRSLSDINPNIVLTSAGLADRNLNAPTTLIAPVKESKASHDASTPDPQRYPTVQTKKQVAQSNLGSLIESIKSTGVQARWGKITEPKAETVPLRSITYMQDQRKIVGKPAVFRLVHSQALKTEIMIDNIAQHPASWFSQNIAADDMSCFFIIVHTQLQSHKTSLVTYHALQGEDLLGYNSNGSPIVKDDPAVTKLLDLILSADDDNNKTRNNRLKMIPRVVSGPYPVKKVVENRPVLLGNKVEQVCFRGKNYFEIDSKVDTSMVAASILKLCGRFMKKIVVDMAWTLQGEQFDELPERLLCGSTTHNMELSKCSTLQLEMQLCPKLEYAKPKETEEEQKSNET